jgi:hypothetical protein
MDKLTLMNEMTLAVLAGMAEAVGEKELASELQFLAEDYPLLSVQQLVDRLDSIRERHHLPVPSPVGDA